MTGGDGLSHEFCISWLQPDPWCGEEGTSHFYAGDIYEPDLMTTDKSILLQFRDEQTYDERSRHKRLMVASSAKQKAHDI